MARAIWLTVLVLSLCGCKKEGAPEAGGASGSAAAPTDHRPHITAALTPPQARGLVIGQATLEDAKEAFPGAVEARDKRLGGDKTVEYNEQPAVLLTWTEGEAKAELWLAGPKADALRLQAFDLQTTPDACAWVEETVGADPEATHLAGSNRKLGKQKGGVDYAGGTADGKLAVSISCHPFTKVGGGTGTELAYEVMSPKLSLSRLVKD